MKVAVMCSSFAVGGAENMVAQLLENIDTYDKTVFAVLSNPKCDNHIQRIVEDSGIKCYYASPVSDKNFMQRIMTFFRINRILKNEKPDVIHTNLSIVIYAVPYIIAHKTKLIHTVHNLPEKDAGKLMRFLFKMLVKLHKIQFSSISQVIQEEIIRQYGIAKNLAPVIINPVDCDKYSNLRAPKKHTEDCIRFISVGRLAPQKNQRLLIQSFSKVHANFPNTELVIAGEGYLRRELETLVGELGLEKAVFLLGNRDDMPALLRKADIFVLSSDYEGLPLTVLEAMASGLAVISTDVGGVRDIVGKDEGLLVESKNERQLADAMMKLVSNNNLRNSIGLNAVKAARKYDISVFTKKYESLYIVVYER